MSAPILILCAHGTRDPAGQASVRAVAESVAERLGVEVRTAYVDVQEPHLDEVVLGIPESAEGIAAVVVPYLLAGGYHVHVDIANAVLTRPDVVAALPLGPDPRLIAIVRDRVAEAAVQPTATLVLAPAGSSDARSQADTEKTLDALRLAWDGPVRVGYAAGLEPTVAQAVEAARANGEYEADSDVAVVSYLLSPGFFQDRLGQAGADQVTEPLAPDERLVDIIADRYRDAGGT
jgi:sirohydrochlorin ferrochelatase